ncbi:SDR family NAD(P)-dependent oxidoreductase [Agromyces albus]|uniref:SDR family NAD(P)-dependent oxidoreductase n=1 Tax=Agromyces albus TaxID=205332 RepID=UPI002785CA09|nr:SDR family NAD(P)-dependent oxidoreductase [Agromyces albus]MDQ0577714.1 NAD(P)-dependent dehydrogenase (short-subunit alcohol dehydrogenase family) [Agromyces albus]
MKTVLITGANKGLGFETARRLLEAGHTVYIGARHAERGRIAADALGARLVLLDVTDDSSVDAAAATIAAKGGLDVLINNAGLEERTAENGVPGAGDETAASMERIFETNVFGVVRMLHAFLPLLQRSREPVIVNVSSGLGSLSDLSEPDQPTYFYPGVAYPASKTTLNAITIQYAKAFPDMRINAVDPGYTNTDLNGRTGTQSVEEGASIIVRMAQIGSDGPTGAFLSAQGAVRW